MIALMFYRQWRYLALLIVMLAVVGYTSLSSVGRQEDPTITNLFATIVTSFPGATASQVEALVTERIETELREIDEIHEINSTSRQNISVIQIELSSFVPADTIESIWSEVRDAIAQAQPALPASASAPVFDSDRAGAYTSIVSITPSRSQDIALAQRYALSLQDQLRLVPNTKLVRIFGMNEERIRVAVDLQKLQQANLTLTDLVGILAQHDIKQSAGKVESAGSDLLLQPGNQFQSVNDVMNTTIAAATSGQTLLLGDVASVEKGLREPLSRAAYHNQQRTILVGARMQSDKQVHVWSGAINSSLERFTRQLPDNIELETIFNQNDYTTTKINDLLANLAIGIVLVIAILIVTMGMRVALIVASIIPLATLLSMIVFRFIDMTIHQMSITGLIVSLGLLVDSAIVMTDEIKKNLSQLTVQESIQKAVARLWIPLSASTITTILAFMPMVMLPGPSGDFVGSIAISVIVMLVASLLLSLIVTPAIAGQVLTRFPTPQREWQWQQTIALKFRNSLVWAYSHKRKSIPLALLLPIAGFALFPTLTAQFFPGVDRDQFHIEVQFSELSSLTATTEQLQPILEYLNQTEGVKAVSHIVGESFPAFYYNIRSGKDNTPSYAHIYVQTEDAEATGQLVKRLQPELATRFPAAQLLVRKLNQGPPVDAPVEIRVTGTDLHILQRLGDELRLRLAGIESVTSTRASLTAGAPSYQLDIDAASVRALQLTPAEVSEQVRLATIGAPAGFILEDTVQVPVWLKSNVRNRESIINILSLPIQTPAAGTVPLEAIASVTVTPADGDITRLNSERVNIVQAFIDTQVLPDVVFQQVQKSLELNPLAVPAGYEISFGGDAGERAETLRNLVAVLGLVVSLTVITIVMTFNSFRVSAIALLVCLLSVGLSLLSLIVLRYPFGIQAIIGLIGAIGVSINAAIIILTSLQAAAANQRLQVHNVVQEVMHSSKHITSTTLTTFFGFLPLILGGGAFWPPFAVAVAGGVLLSVLLSFYLVPCLFILLAGNQQSQSS
ncbi:Multidrug efflux pump subunit AcrB [Pseudidiomarina planktonica]|uniref:Multidrug efflux pump subunit AcrB n=1 Tax=Pseudidiomarina planktonica TaxID=1323738 RepID=A0A1Y6E915_9GAMM|nr:efflux RND transporter permease subunit [Pseudidiomarina planktonica]RUO66287.1 AcrB/AcrD/AcrF family protein [Pseudidiomarina planktonica]SMQ59104.1 Multidrug efflux pump subunit AcrB [Pseudidiomarina planktonica]